MVAVTAPPSSEFEHENAIVNTATAPGVKGKDEFGTILGLKDNVLGYVTMTVPPLGCTVCMYLRE